MSNVMLNILTDGISGNVGVTHQICQMISYSFMS